jgi:hypothetical protein
VRVIPLVKEVKELEMNILLKSNSLITKFLMIKNNAAPQKSRDKRCETYKKSLNFLAKKTSSIKIIKAPENSVISGEIRDRFINILFILTPHPNPLPQGERELDRKLGQIPSPHEVRERVRVRGLFIN